MKAGVKSVAIRSLPPPIRSSRPYSSSDHCDRQAELAEGGVEGGQVAEALGIGEDAVAVEEERGQRPLPSLPNMRMCSCAMAITSARWARKSDGGS